MSQAATPADAVQHIQSGMNVFVHGAAATPVDLLNALSERDDLRGVTLFHLHTEGTDSFVAPAQEGRLRSCSFFVGPAVRRAIEEGRADYVPVFLSEIPHLLYSGRVKLDAALLTLSPADRHGLHTLGTSVDVARAAVDVAPLLIAEVNPRVPRTHGNTAVPAGRLTSWAETDRELPARAPSAESDVERRIGESIADLVDDGATLQMGIGAIPDAVLRRLTHKRGLGVHTEMFSDALIDLIERGVVSNEAKAVSRGRTVTSFISGSRRLYDFVDDNRLVEFLSCDRTNDTAVIRRNPKVIAINSALQIDLTGQVCADSLGHRIYSGIGGQMDFVRGASLSPGGKPIIALPSTARGGTVSRISPLLSPGAGVVTTRGHVHWVVTEHGVADLAGRSLRERGEALISVAHPDFRSELKQSLAATRHFALRV